MEKRHFDRLLSRVVSQDASDLFLTVGVPPHMRLDGKVKVLSMPALHGSDMDLLVHDLLSEKQLDELNREKELNIAIMGQGKERFRINIYYQQHHLGMVIRRVKKDIPTAESLGLPEIYTELALMKRGLILVVGATGSGKSTSVASMLGVRNTQGSGHIITVEDPIEFVHEPKNCIFTQREIGIDTHDYHHALKNTLRQSPDVVVVGEIRDRETMESALYIAETGHLCIATIHAGNAIQTIERVINLFPEEARRQALASFALNLKAILVQQLVPKLNGGRALATEVMFNEGVVKQLLHQGDIKEIQEVMIKQQNPRLYTMDSSLLKKLEAGEISEEVAIREADNPGNLRLRITQMRSEGASKEHEAPQIKRSESKSLTELQLGDPGFSDRMN